MSVPCSTWVSLAAMVYFLLFVTINASGGGEEGGGGRGDGGDSLRHSLWNAEGQLVCRGTTERPGGTHISKFKARTVRGHPRPGLSHVLYTHRVT